MARTIAVMAGCLAGVAIAAWIAGGVSPLWAAVFS